MGCFHSKLNNKCDQNFQVVQSKKGTSHLPDIDIITPDPDLGWRQICQSFLMNGSINCAVGAIHTDLQDWVSSSMVDSAYPQGWTCFFFNDRSGHLCHVSLITLALNISIRAKLLAEAFGVQLETQNPENHNISNGNGDFNEGSYKRREAYIKLNIPDFGWKLISRADNLKQTSNTTADKFSAISNVLPSRKRISKQTESTNRNSHHSTNLTKHPVALQLLKRTTSKTFLADVPSIGMNIAEQLNRLERKQENQNFLPTNLFGWIVDSSSDTCHIELLAKSPDGDTVEIVPEEMILNVTQWVQQTYLTSVVF